MFANLSTREKILLTIALIAAFVAVYYFYFYQPLVEEISLLESERDQKFNRLEIAKSYALKLPEIKEEYNVLVAELEERGVYIDKNVIDLLIDFREVSYDNNLKLDRFRPEELEKGIQMEVNISGGFREICNLFFDFNEWNYWFEFKELDIKRNDSDVAVNMNVMYHDRLTEGVETDVLQK